MNSNNVQSFDVVNTDLQPGVNLIEASAGTGKTFAIAMLALRFIVEMDLRIEQLLIVTFTKAATEELKERIRARLADAKRALEGNFEKCDAVLTAWVQTLAVDKPLARQRLQLALLDIDRAGIFTIHGFCQRVLNEHALESGQVFDAELSGDMHAIRQQIADDFWRLNVLAAEEPHIAALFVRHYKTPDELLRRIGMLADHVPVYPAECELQASLDALRIAMQDALIALPALSETIRRALSGEVFKSDYGGAFDNRLQDFENWLVSATGKRNREKALCPSIHPQCFDAVQDIPSPEGEEASISNSTTMPADGFCSDRNAIYVLQDPASVSLFTRQTLLDGLNGNKFRSNKTHSGEQRKQLYLDELGVDSAPYDVLAEAFRRLFVAFRCAFIRYLRGEREKKLHQLNVLSFDELIGRLAEALRGERAEWLRQTLRQRFKAALIDEFQDTDQQQWHIFSTLFGDGDAYLYLIGDPKQAIYKFRGADIFSYFEAQRQADRHFTLEKNWRSQRLLVEAVNAVFKRHSRPFWFDELHFIDVQAALGEAPAQFHPPLVFWQLPASDSKDGYWTAGKARLSVQEAVVREVLLLINGERRENSDMRRAVQYEQKNRFVSPHLNVSPKREVVAAQDIAILVRTNQAARAYQQALHEVGVPAVLNSVASVFADPEARELYILLQALAHPGDSLLLKQALTLPWFDLDGRELYRLGNDEAVLDAWTLRIQEYHRQWQSDGLMAMLLEFMRRENVYVQLARRGSAERRIANIQHLLELLQQACIDEHLGLLKTLDWLLSAIAEAEHNAAEEQRVRLESDAQAVQIVTLHRSKGLEYQVVFCPDLWQGGDRFTKETELIECHEDGKRIADLGSDRFEARRKKAMQEELAEDLRIVYVALTRAKYRCYVAWADVRSKDRANGSALAYLLYTNGGENWREALVGLDFAAQQRMLQSYGEMSDGFEYRLLDIQPGSSLENANPGFAGDRERGGDTLGGVWGEDFQSPASILHLAARVRTRQLLTDWQMSSYTALSALSMHDAPELPEDKAQEAMLLPPVEQGKESSAPDSDLPKGAHTGNVVHELLETQNFRILAAGGEIGAAQRQACLRYGLTLEQPQLLGGLLQTVVQTPLSENDPDFILANLAERQCLKEMPFYLSLPQLGAERINRILGACPAFQSLHPKQLQGFLTGFIDLVCAYKGRYYVVDYKTNALAGYDQPQLLDAMREHNYGLQYWIYTLVLHRYLQNRLPEYDYKRHFGGVRYLFVRGMRPERPMQGIFAEFPDIERLQALQELFG